MPPSLVFACCGQSNMDGRATNAQSYSHATLQAEVYNGSWVELTDSAYGANNGSFIPPLATLIMALTGSTVGFIPQAEGGTSITLWVPGSDKYFNLGQVIAGAGRCDAVLWWQGETDAINAMSQATYRGHLEDLADGVWDDFGIPLVACKLQNSTLITDGNEATINAAIDEVWNSHAHVIAGPDLSDLATTSPAGDNEYHLVSDAMMVELADRWFDALVAGGLVAAPSVAWRSL